jgi:hypothetical protein
MDRTRESLLSACSRAPRLSQAVYRARHTPACHARNSGTSGTNFRPAGQAMKIKRNDRDDAFEIFE